MCVSDDVDILVIDGLINAGIGRSCSDTDISSSCIYKFVSNLVICIKGVQDDESYDGFKVLPWWQVVPMVASSANIDWVVYKYINTL